MPRTIGVAKDTKAGGTQISVTLPPDTPSEPKPTEKRPDFWTYMASLTPEQWKEHIVYLTREEPKTGIRGIGGYLTKLQQSFDIDDVKNAFGGRKFSYIMKKGGVPIYHDEFQVEAPPKFDTSREVPEASNGAPSGAPASESKLVGEFITVLREELARTREQNASTDPVAVRTFDMMDKAFDRALDKVGSAGGGGTDALSILDKLKGLGVLGGGGGGGILETITVLERLGVIAKPVAATSPMTQFMEMFTFMDKMKEFFGGRGAAADADIPKDWKAMLAGNAPDLLKTAREWIDMRIKEAEAKARAVENVRIIEENRKNPGAAPVVRTPASPAVEVQPANAAPAAPASSPLRVVPAGEATAEPAPATTATDADTETVVKRRIVEMVETLDSQSNDEEVAEVAADIVDMMSMMKPGMENGLVAFHESIVTEFLGKDPILSRAVAHSQWAKLLTAARAYIKESVKGASASPPLN